MLCLCNINNNNIFARYFSSKSPGRGLAFSILGRRHARQTDFAFSPPAYQKHISAGRPCRRLVPIGFFLNAVSRPQYTFYKPSLTPKRNSGKRSWTVWTGYNSVFFPRIRNGCICSQLRYISDYFCYSNSFSITINQFKIKYSRVYNVLLNLLTYLNERRTARAFRHSKLLWIFFRYFQFVDSFHLSKPTKYYNQNNIN